MFLLPAYRAVSMYDMYGVLGKREVFFFIRFGANNDFIQRLRS